MSEELIFTLFYLILSACIIYPPVEFVSAGLTIPTIFGNFLGSEETDFISYHIKRSIITLVVYSFLPLGYISILLLVGYNDEVTFLYFHGTAFWKIFFTTSLILPIMALCQVRFWTIDNYRYHPIAINLMKFCNNSNVQQWNEIASDINNEFRRIEKICINTNPLSKIIATENWILKVVPFTIYLSHQSDSTLIVKESDTHQLSHQTISEIQYLNIEVKSNRRNVEAFVLRINANDFKDLEDRIARRIMILPNVKFHKSVLDQFIDVFKETVQENARYNTDEELEQCIGCMQARSNIKLQKLCQDRNNDENNCTNCYCRPMWCVDCMAKWFASRQENDQRNTWLSSKCTCPMCRSKFCLLDVCLVNDDLSEE